MKQGFISGVLASIVAGGLLWGGAELYADYKKDRAKVIGYDLRDKDTLVTPELLRIIRDLEQGNVISTVTIKNSGREDLVDARIAITDVIKDDGSNLLDFGIIDAIGERVETPKISKERGKVVLHYPILRPGEGSKIWIANKGYSSLELRNAQAGVILEEYDSVSENVWTDLWDLLVYAGIAFIAFVLGLLAGDGMNRHILKRVGLDPDEVAKLYAESEKK